MEKIWFIFSNDEVFGPYSTEQVKKGLDKSQWDPNSQIWWKGQSEWVSLSNWEESLPDILDNFKSKVQKSIWYVQKDGLQKGPLTWVQLENIIKDAANLDSIKLWTAGMKKWHMVFELPDVADQFAINRRKYPRAPIKGTLTIHKSEDFFNAKVFSISEGGIGFQCERTFYTGEQIRVKLNSPMLIHNVNCLAKVVHIGKSGFVGVQFENLDMETKSAIIDYIKQFQTKDPLLQPLKAS